MEILRTENLKKYYGEGDTCVKALDGGRPGPANLRLGYGGREEYFFSEGGGTDHFPQAEDRLCVPEL